MANIYKGVKDYTHKVDKLGILLVNLGTPATPTAAGLRPFLRRFLNDFRVIENNTLLWKFLLNCIIIPLRAPKSAKAYSKVWHNSSSPLNTYSYSITKKLQADFKKHISDNIVVSLGMSYSEPTIHKAMEALRHQAITKLVVLPLYPQYSCSTVASVFDAVVKELTTWRLVPDLRMIHCYHDDPKYIDALAKSVKSFRQKKKTSKSPLLIFSFHGMPLSSLLAGDPYHCQCYKTARLVAERLGLNKDEYKVCFQSRFGRAKWLQPYTDKTLESLPQQGIDRVQLICPGFVTDCVETLEEIKLENHEIFLEAGGKKFDYIPCLNDSDEHIKMLVAIIKTSGADLFAKLTRVNKSLTKGKKMVDGLVKGISTKDYYIDGK